MTEKLTGEKYASKASMDKHEKGESASKQKSEMKSSVSKGGKALLFKVARKSVK